MSHNQPVEHEERKSHLEAGDRIATKAENKIRSEATPEDREALSTQELAQKKQDDKTRALTPAEAAVMATKGARVLGDATKALGSSPMVVETKADGKVNTVLPGRTTEDVAKLDAAEVEGQKSYKKSPFPFDPDVPIGQAKPLEKIDAGLVGKAINSSAVSASDGGEPARASVPSEADIPAAGKQYLTARPPEEKPILIAQNVDTYPFDETQQSRVVNDGSFGPLIRVPAEQTGTVTDYPSIQKTGSLFKSGMNYHDGPDNRTPTDKLQDFMAAAAARINEPAGQKAYMQGQINKLIGIGEGLNTAKEQTKGAVAVG